MMVREFVFGMPAGGIAQSPVRERTWDAILVTENGGNGNGNGPEPEPASLWWLWLLLGVGGSAVVAARIKKVLDRP